MVGKKSGRQLQREEGLSKTDNNLPQTAWPQVSMINQKNYYTEYLKRDDQYLAFRTTLEENTNRMVREARDRDRALTSTSNGVVMPDRLEDEDVSMQDVNGAESLEPHGSKIIVIHLGSQNLRIGFANDALPKTVPMVLARRSAKNESEEDEEPKPKRVKIDGEVPDEPEKWFGNEFATTYNAMSLELKKRMKANKRRLMPNSKELVVNFNRKSSPDIITEHNDPHRIDWTEISSSNPSECIIGQAALRIADNSKPRYKLYWPIRHGWLNEKDYTQKNLVFVDIFLIIENAIKSQLGLSDKNTWQQYSCVFVIPDLYEKVFVTAILDEFMRGFRFKRACFIQEGLAASFGAGYSTACVVDIGAQKTSICCVEDGMVIEDSRINIKYGGADVSEFFLKMMLYDHFPYSEINLKRRYDFLLSEELMDRFCTMDESMVSVQTEHFHLRAAGQDTRKYMIKYYDESFIAPMGYYNPKAFDHATKLLGRRSLIDRSYDLYDGSPNDPTSTAQQSALQWTLNNIPSARLPAPIVPEPAAHLAAPIAKPPSFHLLSRLSAAAPADEATPRSSIAGSPAPDGISTPAARGTSPDGGKGDGEGSFRANGTWSQPTALGVDPTAERIRAAAESDRILPLMPLDAAIVASIRAAARGEDRRMRDFLGGIMVVGGGGKWRGFNAFLEVKLREAVPGFAKEIMVGVPPRELDQQLVVWKGGSVFGRLSSSGNDSWVYQKEYDMLGAKLLAQKCMWSW